MLYLGIMVGFAATMIVRFYGLSFWFVPLTLIAFPLLVSFFREVFGILAELFDEVHKRL